MKKRKWRLFPWQTTKKVIAGLQTIVTDLAQQADGHQLQSRIFANMGFTKLADKYAEHADEERGWVTKCIDRLLDLGCDVKLEAKREASVCKKSCRLAQV